MSFFKTITVEAHEKEIKALRERLSDERREMRIDFETEVRELTMRNDETEISKRQDIAALKADHEIALKKEAHKLAVIADERVLAAEKKAIEAEKRVAVLEKEVEMSGKAEEVGAQVLDVKELVTGLINKLPTIDISTISVNASQTNSKVNNGADSKNNNKV